MYSVYVFSDRTGSSRRFVKATGHYMQTYFKIQQKISVKLLIRVFAWRVGYRLHNMGNTRRRSGKDLPHSSIVIDFLEL